LQFEGLIKIVQETFEKKRAFNEEQIRQDVTDLEEELKKLRSQLSVELQNLQGIKRRS
jgi:hypothetical protein